MTERGMPEVELNIWMGLFMPAETPRTIVATLTDALAEAAEDPAFNALLMRARLPYSDPAATIGLPQKERNVVTQLGLPCR